MTVYDREALIAVCESAVVPEANWYNRDSSAAHEQLGSCWALLKAGCEFIVKTEEASDRTIWVEVFPHGFMTFEVGRADGRDTDSCTFYLPTQQRLAAAAGGDWY